MSCLEWENSPAVNVVFAHANGFNAQTYCTLLAPLAGALHVWACDLRGHGFSMLPAPPGLAEGWTIFRDDLMALVARLPAAPTILAGHSLGATASLMAAAIAPAAVRALVLVEPVLMPPLEESVRANAHGLATRALQRRSVFGSVEEAFRAYHRRGIFVSWPDAVLEDYLEGGLIPCADGSLRLACAPEWEAEIFRRPPLAVASLASRVTCPITILHGTLASTATNDQLATIRTLRPDTQVLAVEGASHFLPIEQPERVREEIRRAAERI
jgi:pimeloyl-ACP methyl ester carboxylesterase